MVLSIIQNIIFNIVNIILGMVQYTNIKNGGIIMNKNLKKVTTLAALTTLVMTSCGSTQTNENSTNTLEETYTIGICQLVTHDALDAATQGFMDTLTNAIPNVSFDLQNAAGDSNTCSTMVNSFVANDVDLIMANATPALIAASAATIDIPILGTSVTEYGVALGLEDFNGTVGGNVSGTSDLAPLDEQADMIIELFPETQNVGLLYCSAEANSQYQVDVVASLLEEKGIRTKLFPFSDSNDLAAVTQTAVDFSDVIYVPTDNTVASNSGIIDNVARPAGIPIIAGEEGTAKGCGVATLSIDYYDLGVTTGNMAIEILEEGGDISTMEVSYADNFTPKYNAEIAAELGVEIPETYTVIE